MITTTDFAKYLSRFLTEYLPHERNVSTNTIASYRDAFVQYIDFMKDVKEMLNRRLGLMGVLFVVVVVLAYSMAFANSANVQQWIGEWK